MNGKKKVNIQIVAKIKKEKRKFDCIPLFLIPLPLQDLYMYEKDDEYLAAV